ncbi:MAG: hypothetical protein AAGE85_18710 [Pseudomonadota bacterium]
MPRLILLTRRSVLAALAAVSAVPLAACDTRAAIDTDDPIAAGLDLTGVAAIAASYRAATGDLVGDDARRSLFPRNAADLAAIKAAVAGDFGAGRLFVHAGWRLSHTEGQLFTILARLSS